MAAAGAVVCGSWPSRRWRIVRPRMRARTWAMRRRRMWPTGRSRPRCSAPTTLAVCPSTSSATRCGRIPRSSLASKCGPTPRSSTHGSSCASTCALNPPRPAPVRSRSSDWRTSRRPAGRSRRSRWRADGRAPASLWSYVRDDAFVIHVHDRGRGLADPLVGYVVPGPWRPAEAAACGWRINSATASKPPLMTPERTSIAVRARALQSSVGYPRVTPARALLRPPDRAGLRHAGSVPSRNRRRTHCVSRPSALGSHGTVVVGGEFVGEPFSRGVERSRRAVARCDASHGTVAGVPGR